MQQRYYDPVAGRFLSADPVRTDASSGGFFNRYAYALNNPFTFVDPTGMAPDCSSVGGSTCNSTGSLSGGVDRIGEAAAGALRATSSAITGGYSDLASQAASRGELGSAAGYTVAASVFGAGNLITLGNGSRVLGLFGLAAKGRVFTSADPLVGNLATKIDAAYPGHVIGVNVPIRDAAGRLVTDADILLRNGVVQVKSGGGKGLTSQLQRTEQATGLPAIGYGPDLKPSILRGCAATNCERTLIEVVRP